MSESLIKNILWTIKGMLAVMVFSTLAVLWLVMNQSPKIENTQQITEKFLSRDVELIKTIKDIRLDVIQVQQWLTDISATRGLDGLNDGFDEAANYAKAFNEDSLKALNMASEQGLDSLVQSLKTVRENFTPYYEVGQRMAQAYVDGGPASGNATMAEFDAAAAALSESVDKMSSDVDRITHEASLSMISEMQAVVEGNQTINTLLIVAFLLMISVGLYGMNLTRQRLAPLGSMSDVVRKLAAGQQVDIPAMQAKDEIGEIARSLSTIHETAVKALVSSSALEQVHSPVMMVDPEGRVIYHNQSLVKLAKSLDRLPGMQSSIGQLLNEAIPAGNDRIKQLIQVQRSHTQSFEIAGYTLEVIANPVKGVNGEHLGTVIEWHDLTADVAAAEAREKAAEEERLAIEEQLVQARKNLRIRSALDHVATPVILVNRGHRIVYLNQSANNALTTISEQIRHEEPGYQLGNVLDRDVSDMGWDSRSLSQEHFQRLNGSEHFELNRAGVTLEVDIRPVLSDDGERLGTVIQFENRTSEHQIETQVQTIVSEAERGEFHNRLPESGASTFINGLSQRINRLIDLNNDVVQTLSATMQAVAAGDLTQRVNKDYQGAFGQLKDHLNQTVDSLAAIVGSIQESASTIHGNASELASGNQSLSTRTEQQAQSLIQTTQSMETLITQISATANNAQLANNLSSEARSLAQRGGSVVTDAVEAMQAINQSSQKISEIIGVIDEIAFQTNLLALNASVEAARAGEQGRGFAVVATEVRNLAQRSASSAKAIKELIQDSGKKVETGTELVNASGQTLEEIVEAVNKVGTIISEIADSSQEQTQGVAHINIAINKMDEMTQQNAGLAEEATASSMSMTKEANDMAEEVRRFRMN